MHNNHCHEVCAGPNSRSNLGLDWSGIKTKLFNRILLNDIPRIKNLMTTNCIRYCIRFPTVLVSVWVLEPSPFFYHAPAKLVCLGNVFFIKKSDTYLKSTSNDREKNVSQYIDSCQQPAIALSFCLRSAKVDDLLNRLFIFQQVAAFHDCKVHWGSYTGHADYTVTAQSPATWTQCGIRHSSPG